MDADEVNTAESPQNEGNIATVVGLCRVCLIGSDEMKNLFHENEASSLSAKAMSFTNAKMSPGDGLPGQVCATCAEKLESAYEFKLQVEQADSILREKYVTLNIKEELFFNEVEVHMESEHTTNRDVSNNEVSLDMVEGYGTESLDDEIVDTKPTLLKDHLALLQVEELAKEVEETSDIMELAESMDETTTNVHISPGEIVTQEHGYVVMPQRSSSKHNLIPAKTEYESMEIPENNPTNESEIDAGDATTSMAEKSEDKLEVALKVENMESLPTENVAPTETRKSKRKSARRAAIMDPESDVDSYFENLNLSLRLKQNQADKNDTVYYMCYICDKHFLSKGVLKEHMHSHEEVRKTLSLAHPPAKTQKPAATPKHSPSGKQPNKCPHCGKEYLYVISFNKHLKQHENEKQEPKEEPMPLEVSFHEDDNTLDFDTNEHAYYSDTDIEDENQEHVCAKCNESFNSSKDLRKHMLNHETMKCKICEEEFEGVGNLKDHQAKHVAEGVMTEADVEKDIKSMEKLEEDEELVEVMPTRMKTRNSDAKGLQCPKCPMVYSHKKSLSRHMETHSGTKYGCKACNQQFTRKDHLRRHMEQHARMKSFKCTQCNKTFGNELTLRNHLIATNHKTIIRGEEYDPNKRLKRVAAKEAQKFIDKIKTDDSMDDNESSDVSETSFRKSHESKEYECATCNRKCASKQSLAKHMELHIKEEKREREAKRGSDDDSDFDAGLDWPMDNHECSTCKKRYSTKKSLLRHQLLHEEPNFECDICNVKFYRKDKLKAHYDKCSEKNPDQVRKCNICGDSFESNDLLKEHRAKHVTEGILTEDDLRDIEPQTDARKSGEKVTRKRRTDIVGLECTECNKRYTSRKGLLRHIQVHEGKKYLCDICPKKFYRREHLKIHVAKHNMIKPYKCDRCTKRFAKEEQLNNHLSKHDRNFKKTKETDSSKRFLCEICSKSFTQSTTLIAHLRAHNGIKPYVCEVCSRPFTTNAYLKMHMRTHTQERPYICQYCSRAFARADTLANHLTSHTGEAKYHCKYCPKNFRRLKSLKEHVFIHTGQRPYACPTCDRRFNNNGSRYAHSKRCKQNLLQNQNKAQNPITQTMVPMITTQINTHPICKTQTVKTITIARPTDTIIAQHIMQPQEILMPIILPLTVTLADVGQEVILPEGTKIFTTT